ncbi:glycosyltransferase [Georgenia sp. AZ-5]|uniref:glycosyltransferase family protein n=1 Tax=Georgenia sp. AZ-5 TaxID=3367526 RepID=UPI0037551526
MPSVKDLRTALWHLRKGGLAQLRSHQRRERAMRGMPGVDGELRDKKGRLTFAPWPLPDREPRRPGLRVAVILDDFSRLAFRYEWQQVEVTPSGWRETLNAEPVDLLFVESAWHGNGDAWQYHLTGTSAPRPALVELVSWCRDRGIPTVFWNKEDPVHYADFLDVARLFDHVFTTDSDRLDDYRRDLGHDRVGTLSFAAQQSIHNPARPSRGHQSRDIAFAGMYFAHKYPERREQMDLLLGAANAVSGRMNHGLEIFSRYLGGDERYQFPEPFGRRVVGSLDYPRMLSAYRAYKVFLNVNSVVGSPSMCARRIFEITASGTPVVSAQSPAIDNFFDKDTVAQVSDPQETQLTLRALVRNPEARDRMVHLGQRRIWSEHTYTKRVDQVLLVSGIKAMTDVRPSISVLVSTNRPHQLDHVLTTVAAQVEVAPQLLVLAHGFAPDVARVRAQAVDLGIADFRLLEGGAELTLGNCLNRLVDAADGEVVTKMDDDDLYGPHYLSDQIYAMDYSGADVVGKHAHYMYLGERNATVLRFPEREHRYTDLVMGPTLMAHREVLREHRFPDATRGEDTGFLRAVVLDGGTVYSSDRFNFMQIRGGGVLRRHQHTWEATDSELLANADLKFYGQSLSHVMI